MSPSDDLESRLRYALFGSPNGAATMEMPSKPEPGAVVILSVRRDLGPPFRFIHRASTFHRTEAILEAEQEAKKQGLRPWALLDVQ